MAKVPSDRPDSTDRIQQKLNAVTDDGKLVKLGDGSVWEVAPPNESETRLWLRMAEVSVVEGDNPAYPYRLYNADDNAMVDARPAADFRRLFGT